MTDEPSVTVPCWALQLVMDNACFWDKGPPGEGWRSDEMIRATDVLEKALEERSASM
jgi:hypothetical protein